MLDILLFVLIYLVIFALSLLVSFCCCEKGTCRDRARACRTNKQAWCQVVTIFFVSGIIAFILALVSLTIYILPNKDSILYPLTKYPEGQYDTNTVPHEDVFFRLPDNTLLHGWWIKNNTNNGSYPLVYSHGSGFNLAVGYRIDRYRTLLEMGYSIFVYDYPGYGRSEGSPTENNVYDSAVAAINWLRDNRSIPIQNITVLGRSLGGAPACKLASLDPEPKALILLSTFSKFADCISYAYPMYGWYISIISGVRYDNRVLCGGYDGPTFMYHSNDDETSPISSAVELFGLIKSTIKTFCRLNGFKHDDVQSAEEINQLTTFTNTYVIN